jgi:hypothetical protein
MRADTSNVPPGQGGSTFNDPDATASEKNFGTPCCTVLLTWACPYLILAAQGRLCMHVRGQLRGLREAAVGRALRDQPCV